MCVKITSTQLLIILKQIHRRDYQPDMFASEPTKSLMDVLCDASETQGPEASFLSLTEKRFDLSETTCDKSNTLSVEAFMNISSRQEPLYNNKALSKGKVGSTRKGENVPPR